MSSTTPSPVSLPPISKPMVDTKTGLCDTDWYRFHELRDTGWTAAVGVGSKALYLQYGGQTIGTAYNQAAQQRTDDAIAALSARVVSLEAALRKAGKIDG